MTKTPNLVDMLKVGVHFGHRASKWHPNMEPYIFTERGGVHIINLELTLKKMEEAGEFLKKIGMVGGTLLFVGTKSQAQKLIAAKAEECQMPYVSQRWIGGTLTNFGTVRGRVRHYLDLVAKQESGELKKYTKKEQSEFNKEIGDLKIKVGGLVKMEKLPDAVFILDIRHEKTALREAVKRGIPVVAVCDTNVNPSGIQYVIPANDDALKSIDMLVNFVAESFKEGASLQGANGDGEKSKEEKKVKSMVKAPEKQEEVEKPKAKKKSVKKIEDKK